MGRVMEPLHAPKRKPWTQWTAPVALATLVGGAIAFASLHFLRPDLDPSAHFGSEYALGPHGWIMELVFLLFATGLFALGAGLLGMLPPRKRLAIAGAGLFFFASPAFVVSAIFPTDPLGAPATAAGTIHNTFGLLIFLSIPAGAVLVTAAVWREQPWRSGRPILAALAVASVLAFLAFPTLAAMGLAGLAQRIALSVYIPWLISFAAQLQRSVARDLGVALTAATDGTSGART